MDVDVEVEDRPFVPHRVRWTRADCAMLESSGALTYRYELIEGDIVRKMGQKLSHRVGISRVTAWAYRLFGDSLVQSQANINVSPEDNPTSEPEPDVCVLNLPLSELIDNPISAQIALLIEVSDTTLKFDLTTKKNLYARAGISEYWVLDLTNKKLIIHREPAGDDYKRIAEHDESEMVAPLSCPDQPVRVSELLP
jgi:Uma2 family endonuclease